MLTAAVDRAASMKFPTHGIGLLEALRSADRDTWLQAADQLNELSKGLDGAVMQDERFPGDEVKLVRNGWGAIGFYPYYVGAHLIRRAIQGGSAEAAIFWLQKVLNTTGATGKMVQTLWGVPVTTKIQLTDDVAIVPIADLPDSEQKQLIIEYTHHGRHRAAVTSMLDFVAPQSALVIERRISPLVYGPSESPHVPNDDFSTTNERIKEIALVLTIVGPRVSIPALQWFTFDDPDLELHSSETSQLLEVLPLHIKEYPALAPAEAPEIVRAYLTLHGSTRQKVRVALERINQAQRRHGLGDRAVELSTAFETLVGDNSTTEMTHKVKVRTVRLVAGSNDERKLNAAVMNKAYAIRSQLVHTGLVDANATETIGGQRVAVSDVIDRALLLCVELTKKIIRRGSIPEWSVFDIIEHAP